MTFWPIRRILRWCLFAALIYPLARYCHELSFESDTVVVLRETDAILDHVARGEWRGWGGKFALLQKIPALVLRSLHWPDDAVLRVLGVINLVSFALLALWGWRSLYR